jgi:hypothetical protein
MRVRQQSHSLGKIAGALGTTNFVAPKAPLSRFVLNCCFSCT